MTFVAAVVAVSLAWSGRPAAAEVPPDEVVWYSTGDSYSSGEGVPGNTGACAQAPTDAWGPAAATLLARRGWDVQQAAFTACTGHRVSAHYVRNDDIPSRGSLWEWAVEQGAPESGGIDVLTLSFGGNDIGFADVITDCLPGSWVDVVTSNPAGFLLDGCDIREDTLEDRVDAVDDRDRFVLDDGASGGFGEAEEGGLADFYELLVERHLTERGRLVVAGYPRLFAPSGEWGLWQGRRCYGITRGDANMLGRVVERFETRIRGEVDRANRRLGAGRVHFVSMLDLFGGRESDRARGGRRHELCGDGGDWLNGWAGTPHRSDPGAATLPRVQGSFHPRLAGHEAVAAEVARRLGRLDWEASAPEDGDETRGDENCGPSSDDVDRALCRFMEAESTGGVRGSDAEERVVHDEFEPPAGEWYLAGCELIGDVTLRCGVGFRTTEPASEDTVATFEVSPANLSQDVDGLVVPDPVDPSYHVSAFIGLGVDVELE